MEDISEEAADVEYLSSADAEKHDTTETEVKSTENSGHINLNRFAYNGNATESSTKNVDISENDAESEFESVISADHDESSQSAITA